MRAIKKITFVELDEVVNIHAESLPDDVLPSLGGKVLRRYYEEILSDKTQMLFGVFMENQLLGFCLISTAKTGLAKAILNLHGVFAVLHLILSQPSKFCLAVRQALKRKELQGDSAEISFIAVKPEYQGMSVGRDLIGYGTEWCFDQGIKFLQTKTANDKLRNFYVKKYSAEIVNRYVLCGRDYSEVKWPTPTSSDRHNQNPQISII
jgi:ribosomal protein S18 acetylase RimI-like enzyme